VVPMLFNQDAHGCITTHANHPRFAGLARVSGWCGQMLLIIIIRASSGSDLDERAQFLSVTREPRPLQRQRCCLCRGLGSWQDPGLVLVASVFAFILPFRRLAPLVSAIPSLWSCIVMLGLGSPSHISALMSLIPTLVGSFPLVVPHFSVLVVPWITAVPVPVVAFGDSHQGSRNPMGVHPIKSGTGRVGTVPAIGSSAPVPAIVEEHLFLEAFHDLKAWLYDHQARCNRKPQVDVNTDLRLGSRGSQGQENGKRDHKFIHNLSFCSEAASHYALSGLMRPVSSPFSAWA